MALGVVADVTREVISDLLRSESDKCFHTLKDFSPVFGVNDVSVVFTKIGTSFGSNREKSEANAEFFFRKSSVHSPGKMRIVSLHGKTQVESVWIRKKVVLVSSF